MASLSFPQSKSISGPWLLGHQAFEDLDKVVEFANKKLHIAWELKIENSVREKTEGESLQDDGIIKLIEKEKANHWNSKHNITCELISKEDVRLVDISILGLLRDNNLKDFSSETFKTEVAHGGYGENSLELKLRSSYYGDLDYTIICSDQQISSEIQYELEKWIDKYKPLRVVSIWAKYTNGCAWILFIPFLFALLLISDKEYTSYDEILKKEAISLISTGIDSTNANEAIGLLLQSQFEHIPNNFVKAEKKKTPIYYRLSFLSLFLLIVLMISPSTTIGLGKKKIRYLLFSKWATFVTITLPAVLVLAPFWTYITGWIYS